MINKMKFKTKLTATLVAIFMLLTNISFAICQVVKLLPNENKLDAYSEAVSLSNSSFGTPTITSSTTLPATPSGWSTIDKSEDVTCGVITLDAEISTAEKIENNYKLAKLPRIWTGMNDKQILMINAETSMASTGYQSESLTLESASYYVITFKAYTEIDATASAKLSGEEFEKSENIVRITTNAMWRTYKIYVSTSFNSSVSTRLELWLGVEGENQSTGAVFFDDIQITKYDNKTFTTAINNDRTTGASYKYINLDKNVDTTFVANASFENALSNANWTLIEDSNLKNANEVIHGRVDVENFNKTDANVKDDVTNTTVYGNQYALLINNLQSGYVGYKSAYFTIAQSSLYRLSFLAKTGELTGSATVKLVERNPYTNEYMSDEVTPNPNYYTNSSYEAQTFKLESISTSGYTNSLSNDWKTYSFYIKGNNLLDTEMNLELWLGTADASAKGYVLFDNFVLEEINTNDFDSNSSNGTVANLNQNTTETDFKNATFNLVNIETVAEKYPYAPQNWTLSKSNSTSNVKNGVINTALDNSELEIPLIPAIDNKYKNNNVLMIGNLANNNQSYSSTTVTLSASSYAKITLDVLTSQLVKAKAGVSIVSDDTTIGEILNIDTNSEWNQITIFVKTGYEEKSIKVELSLGKNEEGTGYAFFDNVIYSSTLTAEAFDSEEADTKIDLSKNDWTNVSKQTDGIFETNDWTAINNSSTDAELIDAGVIDTTEYADINHPQTEGKNVLMIKSSFDDTYYTYKSNKYAITSGEYYKVVVWAKTVNVKQSAENKQYKDSAETVAYPYGASISIDGIDAKFTGIDTDGEWKTYTIYINCTTSADITLQLSLGSEKALTKGAVYYSTTSVSKISSDEYTAGISVLNDDATVDNVLAIGSTDVADDTNNNQESTSSNEGGFNWLVVPSLITGFAILFAVVMATYRNIKKNAPKKAKINKPYSRENIKKLENTHKQEVLSIKQKKQEIVKMQNQTAIDLNNARRQNSSDVATLENRYADLSKKIEALDEQKNECNERYKAKLGDLKKMKESETKKR